MLMDVLNIKGKKVGVVKDILIDFYNGEIKGFCISSYKIFKKNSAVLREDIISFNKKMIVSKITTNNSLTFSSIKSMDVLNKDGDIIGIVEDLIICKDTYKIKGVIISTGFVKDLVNGKRIILPKDLILGENSILYYKEEKEILLFTKPHKLFAEVNKDEKKL